MNAQTGVISFSLSIAFDISRSEKTNVKITTADVKAKASQTEGLNGSSNRVRRARAVGSSR